mgnify:CR=1 FL=1
MAELDDQTQSAETHFRRGIRLALDWGKARVGVAACDADGLLCYPVETVPCGVLGSQQHSQALRRVNQLCDEYEPLELVLGWPVDLRGAAGPAVDYLMQIAAQLQELTQLPIRCVDERMTTAQASRQLAASGKSARQRKSIIDQAAAIGILEQAIEQERRTGQPAGRLFAAE